MTLWPEADGLSVAFGGPGGPGIEGEEAGQAGQTQTFGKPLTAFLSIRLISTVSRAALSGRGHWSGSPSCGLTRDLAAAQSIAARISTF